MLVLGAMNLATQTSHSDLAKNVKLSAPVWAQAKVYVPVSPSGST
jgi:hypothetical protein